MSQNFKVKNGLDINGVQIIASNGTITGPALTQITNIVSNSSDTWARTAANSASSYANSAYTQANNATTNAQSAYDQANTVNTAVSQISPSSSPNSLNDYIGIDTINTTHGVATFNGTNNYLSIPYNSVFNIGTNDFTIETHITLQSADTFNGNRRVFSLGDYAQGGNLQLEIIGGNLLVHINGSYQMYACSLTPGVDYHLAVVRQSGNVTVYIDGSSIGSYSQPGDINNTADFAIGAQSSGNCNFLGSMYDFRIVNGTAVYTSTFTPPTNLSSITNTILLLKMNNGTSSTFLDSGNYDWSVTNHNGVAQSSLTAGYTVTWKTLDLSPYATTSNVEIAWNTANASYVKANSGFDQANTGTILAQAAFDSANNVGPQVQPAFNAANSAGSYANSAFNTANNALANTSGIFGGDLQINGLLKVWGTPGSGGSDEGGQIDFAAPQNSTLNTSVSIDVYQNKLRIFETGGTNRGFYLDLANSAGAGVATDLAAGAVSSDTWARNTANAASSYANSAYLHANSAYAAANNVTPQIQPAFNAANSAGSYANSAYTQANTGTVLAQAAFDSANNVGPQVQPAFNAANSAGSYANSSYTQANTATTNAATADQRAVTSGSYANSAYTQANTATTNAATADQRAVTSGSYANSAYTQANTATTNAVTADQRAVTSGVYANSAYAQSNAHNSYANTTYATSANLTITASYANSAYTQANTATTNAATADQKAVSAGSYANSAYTTANTKFASAGGTISGDVNINGNLTITGTTTYANTTTVALGDNIIVLNADLGQSALPTEAAGIEVERGVKTNSFFTWVESAEKWSAFNGNTAFYIGAESDGSYANSAYAAANVAISNGAVVGGIASAAYAHANSAHTTANVAISAGAAIGATASLAYTHANSAYAFANGVNIGTLSATNAAVAAGSYANSAYAQSNAHNSFANTTYATGANLTITGSYANSAYLTANSASSYANGAFASANNRVLKAGDTMTGTLTFNTGGTTKIAFDDTSSYLLATSTNWGIYWNTTDNKIEYHGAGTSRAQIDLDNGDINTSGALTAITKSFLINHPTKDGYKLRYGSLEGPENGVYVRGKLKGGKVIELPDYWIKLVDPDSITVQLTPIGKHQKLYVEDVKDNKVYIANEGLFAGEINCYYYILAERVDVEKFKVEFEG